jgi:uncharacterized membrane protein
VRWILLPHILAGSLGLVSGFIALYAAKGAPLHKRAGMAFVAAMLTMAAFGLVLAVLHGKWAIINISAAITTAYLVTTALATVRPASAGSRRFEFAAMLVGLAVGVTMLTYGLETIVRGGNREGIPAFPFFLFGLLGLFGGIGDMRRLRSGPPRGPVRIARHLWRMSFALFIGAMSFFIGQADVFPKPMRILPLLALPPLAVLLTMLYWVWRIRLRRKLPDSPVRSPLRPQPVPAIPER